MFLLVVVRGSNLGQIHLVRIGAVPVDRDNRVPRDLSSDSSNRLERKLHMTGGLRSLPGMASAVGGSAGVACWPNGDLERAA